MNLIDKHRELVAEKTELRKRIVREQATLESVTARMTEIQGQPGGRASTEYGKARDKRRHIEERLTEANVELVEVEAKLELLQFDADFG